MPWLYLFPVFVTHCVCAYWTYTKTLRDSAAYIPVSLTMTIISTTIFAVAARQLQNTKEIMLFSFVWDALMLSAFYGMPMLLHDKSMGVQSYMAATLIVVGLLWFKFVT